MPVIVWKGITRADDPILREHAPRPARAKSLAVPEHPLWSSLPLALPFAALCFALLFLKRSRMAGAPLDVRWLPAGILAGLLGCFAHEWLHAVLQPRGAVAYIGLIPTQFMFYMKCKEPLTRRRFIAMSLLPVILGAVPAALFAASSNPAANAVLWPMAMIGFISPAPDYLNVCAVLRQTPKSAYIQDDEQGLCWYTGY